MLKMNQLILRLSALGCFSAETFAARAATMTLQDQNNQPGSYWSWDHAYSNAFMTPINAYRSLKTIPTVPRAPGPLGFLRAVGMVEDPARQGHGTAFLLAGNGGCYALTNYHVAFGDKPASTQQTITIAFGQGSVDSFEVKIPAHPVQGGWVALPAGTERGVDDDWALLKLDPCVQDKFGGFEMSSLDGDADNLFDETVSMAGYPDFNDYHKGVTYEAVCPGHAQTMSRALKRTESEVVHHCTVLNYSSGSPLLIREDGKVKVAAMNCGFRGLRGDDERVVRSLGDRDRWNWAVPMFHIKDRIETLIKRDVSKAL